MNIWKNNLGFLIFFILFLSLIPLKGKACTAFSLFHDDQLVFGKNYDWYIERGLMIINKRGVSKKAMPGTQADPGKYAKWISKYGSLTFNQYGCEFPIGGINETGLVVETLLLSETKYPKPDSRKVIKDLQWIQFQLDNYSRIEEVIKSDSKIRILPYEVPGIHYLVSDKTGNCAIIEFLNGKLVHRSQDTMEIRAITNDTYNESMKFLKWHKGYGGKFPITKGESSLDRFVYAAEMLKNYNPHLKKPIIDYAFHILENVSQISTRWSIVYDQKELKVYFHTLKNKKIKYIDIGNLDFSCATPVKVLDISSDLSGNISNKFYEYSRQINLDLIRYAMNETPFMRTLPEKFIIQRAKYPERLNCIDQSQ